MIIRRSGTCSLACGNAAITRRSKGRPPSRLAGPLSRPNGRGVPGPFRARGRHRRLWPGGHGRASNTRLKGVSAARRKRVNPPPRRPGPRSSPHQPGPPPPVLRPGKARRACTAGWRSRNRRVPRDSGSPRSGLRPAGPIGGERDARPGRRAGNRQDRLARLRRRGGGRHAAAAGPGDRVGGPDPVRVPARADPAGPAATRQDPGAAGGRDRERAGPAAGNRARAVRGRCRHAQPARGLRRGGAGGGGDRRRPLAGWFERAGVAVRVPAAGGRPHRGADRRAGGRGVPARRR